MDLMKLLLNQAKGHPSGDLSAMLEGGAADKIPSNNMGLPGSVNVPLHVHMQSRKIPYSSWPQAAKDELTPEMRAAYEADLQKQNPKLFGGPTIQERAAQGNQMGVDSMKAAMLNDSAAQAQAAPNPILQAGIGAQQARRAQGIMPTDGARGPGQVNEWIDTYTDLLVAVRQGRMTEEDAHAQLAPVLAARGIDPGRNPFAKQNASMRGQ